MPRPSTSTLSISKRIEIVLVPFDHSAIFHRGVFDRHDFVETRFRNDEAADMLGKMAREIQQLLGQRESLIEARIGGIEARRAAPALSSRLPSTSPRCDEVRASMTSLDSPKTLPTSRMALRLAIADDRRGHARRVALVVLIDVLDDLFAPLVLEIDVDVGRLLPFHRHEAFEQKILTRSGLTAVMPRQ